MPHALIRYNHSDMLIEGQTVGRYRIAAPIGDGGFALVYRAVHEALGSDHAVKVLKPEMVAIEEIRLRFLDEARIQARLQHPNIVRVTDILALPGVAAIVMDLVSGEPLASWIAARRAPPGPVELRQIMLPLLDALGYAHARGIVHRDLKPENVLLETGPGGVLVPRVLDFGIAKVRGEIGARTNKRSTIADRRMGTSGYMSPEQIRSAKDVDARSDIFALGIMLLEIATLKHPFERASDFDTMHAVVNGDYTIPQDLWNRDPAVASALRVALQTNPADRFHDCAGFANAIGLVAARSGGVPTGPRPASVGPRPAPPAPTAVPPPKATKPATPPVQAPPPAQRPPPQPPPPETPPAPRAPRSSNACGCLAALGLLVLIVLCCVGLEQNGGQGPSSHGTATSAAPQTAPGAPAAPPSIFRASGDAGPALIVGVGKRMVPMFDTTTTPATGFDVDFALELARRLGKQQASLRPLNAVRDAAEAGTVDLSIAAISVTPEREAETLFSIPYLEPALVTVSLPGHPVPSDGNLIGYKCANVHEQYAPAATAAGCDNIAVHSVSKSLLAAEAGDADLVVMDAVEAGQLAPPWLVVGAPIGADRYAVAMQRGNLELKQRVDQAITEMRADGTLGALEERHHVFGLPPEPSAVPSRDSGGGPDAVASRALGDPEGLPNAELEASVENERISPRSAEDDVENVRILPRGEQTGGDAPLNNDATAFAMIRGVIAAGARDIEQCYNVRLFTLPQLRGTWRTSFTVTTSGLPSNVRVLAVDQSDSVFQSCMQTTITTWRFQPVAVPQPVVKSWQFPLN